MRLSHFADYLDTYLNLSAFSDRSNNGLQVEGKPEVRRVAFTVDASLAAFQQAAALGADLLIVHHGMFWSEPLMLVGSHRERVRELLLHGISLYAAHLPLDAHPEVGNNVEMARVLGLEQEGGFGISHGQAVGLIAHSHNPVPLKELATRLGAALNIQPAMWPFRDSVQRVGILTGYAMGVLDEAISLNLDALVCGELGHTAYHYAREANLGIVLGGHYATETFGPKALMRHLAQRFGIETIWIEIPTGL